MFTPRISFTRHQLLLSRNFPLKLPFPYSEHFTFRPVADESGQWAIIMDWTLEMQHAPFAAWKHSLGYLLERFPFHICGHLTSTEPRLLQAIISYSDNIHANPAFVVCSECKTKIEFALQARPIGCGNDRAVAPDFSLHVERRLGRLGDSAADPQWNAQSLPLPRVPLQ